jgi:hypothetical protein
MRASSAKAGHVLSFAHGAGCIARPRWLAGQGDEHLIERGPAHADVVDVDIDTSESFNGGGYGCPTRDDGDSHATGADVHASRFRADGRKRLGQDRKIPGVVASHLDDVAAREALELGGAPGAMARP